MRKLLFIIFSVCLFISSCSVKIPYRYSMDYIDYNTVSQKHGIFITEANSVGFEYEPVGSINLMERSGYEVKYIENNYSDGIYGAVKNKKKYGDWINASVDELLKLACQKALECGGNGIINLKFEYLPSVVVDKEVYPEGYRITGMIIKR